jgi:hypothetical protein
MGYASNSPEWRDCVKQVFLAGYDAENRRMDRAAEQFATGMAILAQPHPQPAPTGVLCRQTNLGVYCQ